MALAFIVIENDMDKEKKTGDKKKGSRKAMLHFQLCTVVITKKPDEALKAFLYWILFFFLRVR